MKDKPFPVLGYEKHIDCPSSVKWSELDDMWAKRVHSQTLERLAERGGLSPVEIFWNVNTLKWRAPVNPEFALDLVRSIEYVDKPAMKDNSDKCDLCGKDRDSHIGDDATCTGYFLAMKDKEALIAEIKYLIEFPFKQATAEEIIDLCATYQDEWISVVNDLAEWSRKYPKGMIYSTSIKDAMDGGLERLEERAKALTQPPTSKNSEA